ncbi:replicative DNA helicase [Corynebacterium sp.]|uniref:replicative DNA helicase n=1 Tax=Corynebacterium sp. TaxID=1720 RepID=UPI0026DB9A62|nr:replicative DNA helicase [Corynebacterium sp.]MDO4611053.1 replicative DNA helicase [Corynebacterium sp.]
MSGAGGAHAERRGVDDDPGVSFADDAPPPPEPFDGPEPPDQEYRRRGTAAAGALSFDRQPPHNIEAEKAVLGGMLLSSSVIADVGSVLRVDDFYRPAHQAIYQAILHLYAEVENVDAILVAGRLDQTGNLDRVGGAPYLHTLMAIVPTAANAHYYAKIVSEKAAVRRLIDAGTKIVALGQAGAEDSEAVDLIDRAQQIVFDVSRDEERVDYASVGELMPGVLDEIEELSSAGGLAQGVPTGFADLDRLTNGLHGGQMIIVAARPGVGKSTLAMDFVRSASIAPKGDKKTSVIFSLEMSKSEIMMRILSAEAQVKLSDIRSGSMDDDKWAKLVNRAGAIEDSPIYIDDSPTLTMMEIRAKARDIKVRHGLDLVVVDYLQLMTSGKKVESRQQEVSEFSRQLKLLAKELDVPVVAISQLNRGPEARTDKKPQVADLRESGSLEQDADMVMLLYRPDSQEQDHERAGEADIILAKHRGGPIGTVTVASRLHFSSFANMHRE